MTTGSILILPGDGIGPEVMAQVRRIIDWYGDKRGLSFDVSEDLVGGAAYDVHGVPLAETHMRHHPLTPMTESNVAALMDAQTGPGHSGLVKLETVRAGAVADPQHLLEGRAAGRGLGQARRSSALRAGRLVGARRRRRHRPGEAVSQDRNSIADRSSLSLAGRGN